MDEFEWFNETKRRTDRVRGAVEVLGFIVDDITEQANHAPRAITALDSAFDAASAAVDDLCLLFAEGSDKLKHDTQGEICRISHMQNRRNHTACSI